MYIKKDKATKATLATFSFKPLYYRASIGSLKGSLRLKIESYLGYLLLFYNAPKFSYEGSLPKK
jgi:hypothetical protein